MTRDFTDEMLSLERVLVAAKVPSRLIRLVSTTLVYCYRLGYKNGTDDSYRNFMRLADVVQRKFDVLAEEMENLKKGDTVNG